MAATSDSDSTNNIHFIRFCIPLIFLIFVGCGESDTDTQLESGEEISHELVDKTSNQPKDEFEAFAKNHVGNAQKYFSNLDFNLTSSGPRFSKSEISINRTNRELALIQGKTLPPPKISFFIETLGKIEISNTYITDVSGDGSVSNPYHGTIRLKYRFKHKKILSVLPPYFGYIKKVGDKGIASTVLVNKILKDDPFSPIKEIDMNFKFQDGKWIPLGKLNASDFVLDDPVLVAKYQLMSIQYVKFQQDKN